MRFLTVFLILACSSMLGACGGADSGQPAPASEEAPDTARQDSANVSANMSDQAASNRDFSHLPAPYNEASYSLGRRTFKLCGTCHTLKEGGQNLVGPNLHGILGRRAGSLDDFRYSTVLEEADFVWTPEKVEEWLSSPRTFLPGNNMTFAGVHKPADRHAVIAYIMLETGYEPPVDQDAGGDTAP